MAENIQNSLSTEKGQIALLTFAGKLATELARERAELITNPRQICYQTICNYNGVRK